MSTIANEIGDAKASDKITKAEQYLSHAALGCLGGYYMERNSTGCGSGAVGAVIAEAVADSMTRDRIDFSKSQEQNIIDIKNDKSLIINISKLTSMLAVGEAGGNIDIAAYVAENAVENNWGEHLEEWISKTYKKYKTKYDNLTKEDLAKMAVRGLYISYFLGEFGHMGATLYGYQSAKNDVEFNYNVNILPNTPESKFKYLHEKTYNNPPSNIEKGVIFVSEKTEGVPIHKIPIVGPFLGFIDIPKFKREGEQLYYINEISKMIKDNPNLNKLIKQ